MVLIDAGSTLTTDDLQTIMALQQAAIPVNVLLSKADLLALRTAIGSCSYVKEHIASECKLDLPVHPVSVVPSSKGMLNDWFENQIVPLYARSQELRAASLRRKIGALRDSVTAALEARLRQRRAVLHGNQKSRRERRKHCCEKRPERSKKHARFAGRFIEGSGASVPEAIEEASKRLLHSWSASSYGVVVPGQLVRDSITQFFQLQVRKLQGEITNLADQLGRDLRICADDLRVPDTPSEGEFQAIIRGTPVLESLPITMAVTRPALAALFGSRMAERRVAGRISRQLREPFYAALEAYWRSVQEWADSVIGQLKQRFENYAESYRAQAEQALGAKALANDELEALAEDLARLKQAQAADRELNAKPRLSVAQ